MRKRILGKTGLNVSELGLGTWGLSGDGYGPVSSTDQDHLIERARMLGITLFETADCYAQGRMEEKLGDALKDDEQAVVVTKWGTDRSGSVVQIGRASCRALMNTVGVGFNLIVRKIL